MFSYSHSIIPLPMHPTLITELRIGYLTESSHLYVKRDQEKLHLTMHSYVHISTHHTTSHHKNPFLSNLFVLVCSDSDEFGFFEYEGFEGTIWKLHDVITSDEVESGLVFLHGVQDCLRKKWDVDKGSGWL